MKPSKPRGLAAVPPERRAQIARMGGLASPANFKYNRDRAVTAGRKGGKKSERAKAGK